MLFQQDSSRSHTSVVAMAKIKELKFKSLPYPSHLPEVAPIDLYLFTNVKNGSVVKVLLMAIISAVSYTHLDVYKRQVFWDTR